MKPASTLRHTSLAVAMLLAVSSAGAFSLGRLRGAAVIGQPLDVSIQVRLETGDDASNQCYDVDVFQGDFRVDASRVRVGTESGASPQDFTIRVRTSAVVEEPVITLYVRSGCSQKVTRRYVILSDVAPDNAAPVVAPSLPVVPQTVPAQGVPGSRASASAPAVRPPVADAGGGAAPSAASRRRAASAAEQLPPAPGTVPAAQAQAAARTPATAAAASTPASAAPAATSRRSRAAEAAQARRPAPESRARLKLDPLELLVERDPTLRPSNELAVAPQENDPRRAEAAALWRALNAQPEDILRDSQRLLGLEGDVKQLRDQGARNTAALAEAKVRLEKAQEERYRNELVYGLGGLLLVALALAGFLWWRGRGTVSSGGNWWARRGDDDIESMFPAAAGSVSVPAVQPGITEVDVDLGVDESVFESLRTKTLHMPAAAPVPLPEIDHKDFVSSTSGGARAVNAEELFDIQQQADFFLSLGQHDQAVEVLKNHISDNVETSALAYLDLLKIYHSLDRRAEYDALREDFNRVFNAQVPVFDAFSLRSAGLEAYDNAMARIVALWPSYKVLEVIEESIFRKPGVVDGEAFDLEAYRELLMLYAIAKELVGDREDGTDEISVRDSETGSSRRSRFSQTVIQPLSAGSGDLRRGELATDDFTVPVSSRVGLDIDLSALPPSEDEATAEWQPSGFRDSRPPFRNSEGFRNSQYNSEFAGAPTVPDLPELAGGPQSVGGPGKTDNLIDFDLFDSSTEEAIAPKPRKR